MRFSSSPVGTVSRCNVSIQLLRHMSLDPIDISRRRRFSPESQLITRPKTISPFVITLKRAEDSAHSGPLVIELAVCDLCSARCVHYARDSDNYARQRLPANLCTFAELMNTRGRFSGDCPSPECCSLKGFEQVGNDCSTPLEAIAKVSPVRRARSLKGKTVCCKQSISGRKVSGCEWNLICLGNQGSRGRWNVFSCFQRTAIFVLWKGSDNL